MSSTDQTRKEYLTHNGVVYWPFTAWDAIIGLPTDFVFKRDIAPLASTAYVDQQIAVIPKPDMSAYATLAALNSYVVKGELPDFTKFALKSDLTTFDPETVYTKNEVDAAIAASESKFASVIDTGWVPVSLLNGAKESGVTNQVRKIGSQVYIEFAAENLWGAKNKLIAILPVGFRPDQTIWRRGRSNAGTDEVEYSIGTDGAIVVGLKSGKNTSADYLWISEPFLAAD